MVQPKPHPRISNPRTARTATTARISHSSRARYTGIVRVGMLLGSVMLMLMGYVMLTSNVTGLTYAVAKSQHDREALVEDNARLEDRIAALRSDDRLAAIATKLGMGEPQHFAVVKLPGAPVVADTHPHIAVLSSLAGFFMPATQQR